MKKIAALPALVATLCLTAVPAFAQNRTAEARFQAAQQRFSNELNIFRIEFDRYQAARGRGYGGYDRPTGYDGSASRYPDERDEGDYDPSHYYRDGPSYQERVLASDDRVYRGQDGRYYCKRNDGTTGLIVGAAGGGILGNVIDGGRSRTVGTLIGGALGALAGRSVEQSNAQVRCR